MSRKKIPPFIKAGVVNVKQPDPPAEPIGAEVIATAIEDIAAGMKLVNSTRLRRSAIVTLIHERSKVARKTIEIVLNNLDDLETTWLKPKAAK